MKKMKCPKCGSTDIAPVKILGQNKWRCNKCGKVF